jgi:Formiminotransferase domain
MPLIAYNINLATDRLDVAKWIAAAIRHSSGGYQHVKAMGVPLENRGIVQVSMNLTNYAKTPIALVFEAVKREAARYGVNILESEIVVSFRLRPCRPGTRPICRSRTSAVTRSSRRGCERGSFGFGVWGLGFGLWARA